MLLYIGAFQFVPLLAVMALVLVSSIAVALVGAIVGHSIRPEGASAGVVPAAFALMVSVGIELGLRVRDRSRPAALLHDLRTIGRSPRITEGDVGAKAHVQARLLVELGLDVPEGWVLTTAACADGPVSDALLRRIVRSAEHHRGRFVVRSTFVGEDGRRTHAGVFESVRDVDLADAAAFRAAVERVRRSGESARARDYGTDDAVRAPSAVLVQRQIEGVRAVVSSRPLDGRADAVWVELEGNAAARELDLLDLDAPALGAATAASDVPDASALLGITLRVERALGGPVQLETVHDGERWWVVQARRVPIAVTRRAYLSEGPIALDPQPRSPIVWALRGGPAGVARGLAQSLVAAGRSEAASACVADAFVVASGRIFADAELLRRVVTSASTLGDSVAQLLFLCRPSPMPGATPTSPITDAAAFHAASLVVQAQHAAQARAVLRTALLQQLARAFGSNPATANHVAALAHRGVLYESAVRDRLRATMAALETEAEAYAARSPAAAAAESPSDSDAHDPAPIDGVRLHRPPSVDEASRGNDRCIPIVDRGFTGPLLRIDDPSALPAPGAWPEGVVVVVPDGSPAYQPCIRRARAIVILRGGVLSHLATLALEADLPSVFWPEPDVASLVDGTELAYRDGRIRIGGGPPCSG